MRAVSAPTTPAEPLLPPTLTSHDSPTIDAVLPHTSMGLFFTNLRLGSVPRVCVCGAGRGCNASIILLTVKEGAHKGLTPRHKRLRWHVEGRAN